MRCAESCSRNCSLLCPARIVAQDSANRLSTSEIALPGHALPHGLQQKSMGGIPHSAGRQVPQSHADPLKRKFHTSHTTPQSRRLRSMPHRIVHDCCGAMEKCANSSQLSCVVAPLTAQPIAMSGFERANLFSRCNKSNATEVPHYIDSFISLNHHFAYADNVKSGSVVIASRLRQILNVSFANPLGDRFTHGKGTECFSHDRKNIRRSTTNCITMDDIEELLLFSIVRDPVAKFESGVRQAWSQSVGLQTSSADTILARQLASFSADTILTRQLASYNHAGTVPWVNEHLQPSTWRLSGRIGGGLSADMNFIGTLETLANDWPEIVKNFANLDNDEAIKLLKPLEQDHSSGRFVGPTGKSSLLSDKGIRRMCASDLYGSEWRCLGYPLPKACQDT